MDCSGEALKNVLESQQKPTVIKPNTEELSQLIGKEVTDDIQELKSVLSDQLFQGIDWIVVSLGAKGLLPSTMTSSIVSEFQKSKLSIQ